MTSDNERAVRFYEKNHLTYEVCFKEYLRINDECKYIYWFSLRKKDFEIWKSKIENS